MFKKTAQFCDDDSSYNLMIFFRIKKYRFVLIPRMDQ